MTMANIKDEYDDQIMHDSRNHLGASECLKKVKDEEAWNFKVIMMRDLVLIIITIIIIIITTLICTIYQVVLIVIDNGSYCRCGWPMMTEKLRANLKTGDSQFETFQICQNIDILFIVLKNHHNQVY